MEYIFIILGIIIDQCSKYFALTNLAEGPCNIINNVFSFTLVKNYNGAFGMFGSINNLLLPLSVIIAIVCFVFMIKIRKRPYKLLTIAVSFIVSGAVGNIIDRIARGYVVDFIRVHLFDFPVFNIADILVVVGAFGAVFLLCFTKAGDVFDNKE